MNFIEDEGEVYFTQFLRLLMMVKVLCKGWRKYVLGKKTVLYFISWIHILAK